MATLGSLTFADGGINGYERVGDTVYMVVNAFQGHGRATSFTLTFHGVTHLEDANRWDERIAKEQLETVDGGHRLTIFDRLGQVLFSVHFASFTIVESEFVPDVTSVAFGKLRGRTVHNVQDFDPITTKPGIDYVRVFGSALIVVACVLLVMFFMFNR